MIQLIIQQLWGKCWWCFGPSADDVTWSEVTTSRRVSNKRIIRVGKWKQSEHAQLRFLLTRKCEKRHLRPEAGESRSHVTDEIELRRNRVCNRGRILANLVVYPTIWSIPVRGWTRQFIISGSNCNSLTIPQTMWRCVGLLKVKYKILFRNHG